MYLFKRQIYTSESIPFILKKLIILLVDHQICLSCSDTSTSTSNISTIVFGSNFLSDIPGIHTHVVTDLNSAVKAVTNYYM